MPIKSRKAPYHEGDTSAETQTPHPVLAHPHPLEVTHVAQPRVIDTDIGQRREMEIVQVLGQQHHQHEIRGEVMLRQTTIFAVESASAHGPSLLSQRRKLRTTIESKSIEGEARHHHARNQDREVQDIEDKGHCRTSTGIGETMADPPEETGTERVTYAGAMTRVVALVGAEASMTLAIVEE